MIHDTIEAWEKDTNPNLTYPILFRRHIREMTRAQILQYIVGNPYYQQPRRPPYEIRTSI